MYLTAETLAELDAVRHGFFARAGGVSTGIYASLNCGYGSADDPGAVRANRARAAAALDAPGPGLITVNQIHSPNVVTVTAPWTPAKAPRADAMVTREPRVTLGILAADCAPVLLADTAAGVVGAAHAGWRGALAGVVERTVDAMVALGAVPGRIVAAIGPCIAGASYEVGPDFPASFQAQDAANEAFFDPSANPGRWQFDLGGYVGTRLAAAGVERWVDVGHDTYAGDYFSYRRTTHRGEPDYGRNLSAIGLVARA